MLVSSRDNVFIAAGDTKRVFAGGAGADLFHPRSIDEDGAMDADEAKILELFGHSGNGFAKEMGLRKAAK